MESTIKINNEDTYESILVFLTREKFPIAFQNKLQELMECEAFDCEAEAIKWIESTPIEMELYYEKHYGLFMVESEAIEGSTVFSPYSKKELVAED